MITVDDITKLGVGVLVLHGTTRDVNNVSRPAWHGVAITPTGYLYRCTSMGLDNPNDYRIFMDSFYQTVLCGRYRYAEDEAVKTKNDD